jgi:hypothetical protein
MGTKSSLQVENWSPQYYAGGMDPEWLGEDF